MFRRPQSCLQHGFCQCLNGKRALVFQQTDAVEPVQNPFGNLFAQAVAVRTNQQWRTENDKVRKVQSNQCLLQFAFHPWIKQARSSIGAGSGNQNQGIHAVFSCGFGKLKIRFVIDSPLRLFAACRFQSRAQAGKQHITLHFITPCFNPGKINLMSVQLLMGKSGFLRPKQSIRSISECAVSKGNRDLPVAPVAPMTMALIFQTTLSVRHAVHFAQYGYRIGGLGNGAAHHQISRTCRQCLGGRHDAALVVVVAGNVQADAGRYQDKILP